MQVAKLHRPLRAARLVVELLINYESTLAARLVVEQVVVDFGLGALLDVGEIRLPHGTSHTSQAAHHKPHGTRYKSQATHLKLQIASHTGAPQLASYTSPAGATNKHARAPQNHPRYNINKFLNRLLGLDVTTQNALFSFFMRCAVLTYCCS